MHYDRKQRYASWVDQKEIVVGMKNRETGQITVKVVPDRTREVLQRFIHERIKMTLRELRKARQLTQVTVARQLGISQDGVSRLEQRSDLLLSALRRAVEAMDGSLSLIATFPDRPPVELSGISERESRD